MSAFFTAPSELSTLTWNVSGLSAATTLRYAVTGYSNSTRDCQGAPTGTVHWAGPGTLLQLTLSFGAGFYEVRFAEVDQAFGIVSLPLFRERHPEGRDPSFSIDAALTQASGVGSRPDFDSYRAQLIESMGRMGLASARERQSTGAVMAANGTMSEWPALNLAVRSEWAAAGVGVVDLSYGTADWMGAQRGASVVRNLSGFALSWRRIATTYPGETTPVLSPVSYNTESLARIA